MTAIEKIPVLVETFDEKYEKRESDYLKLRQKGLNNLQGSRTTDFGKLTLWK